LDYLTSLNSNVYVKFFSSLVMTDKLFFGIGNYNKLLLWEASECILCIQ